MLVIISDLHLGDGTTADSIPASAFYLFAKRLRQDAHFASINDDHTYKPIETLDVILLGDILDPLHSTRWLYPGQDSDAPHRINEQGEKEFFDFTRPGEKDYIRPWSDDRQSPLFAEKLKEVTRAILKHNEKGLKVFRDLAKGEIINFDAEDNGKRSAGTANQRPLQVRLHYMVGNHDWYYHLKGTAYDDIRREIKDAMGLCNPPDQPFPYDLSKHQPKSRSQYPLRMDQNDDIERLFREYKVFVRHGDYYDPFNFDIEKGRDYPTLGDAFTMEVCNRFPPHLMQEKINQDGQLRYLLEGGNAAYAKELRQITNIRPALATPLWVTGQLKRLSQDIVLRKSHKFDEQQIDQLLKEFERAPKDVQRESRVLESKLKKVWDDLVDNFLELEFVRRKDQWGIDIVDKLQLAVKISKTISSKQLDELVYIIQNRNATGSDHSFTRFALEEPAFIRDNDPAKYIVYGHTHHQEIVPVDYDSLRGRQMYFNSGTWHTYFDLARKNPKDKRFVPYKALTYITFYKPSEHGDQDFETWSGAYA